MTDITVAMEGNNDKRVNARTESHLDYIDLLRGLAIIGVMLVHSGYGMSAIGLKELPFPFDPIFSAGRHGVTLFFVVSAFTLTRSMFLRYDYEAQPIKNYLIRRFFRIAPAYYFVLFLVFYLSGKGVAGYTNPTENELTWLDLGLHLIFLNGFFPYFTNSFFGVEWSISTEFMFYLILPGVYLWIRKINTRQSQIRKGIFLYCIAIIISWLMYFKGGYLQSHWNIEQQIFGAWSHFFIGTHLNAFVLGIIVWLFIQKKQPAYSINRDALFKLVLALLIITAVCATVFEYQNADNPYLPWISVIFWGIASATLTYTLSQISPTFWSKKYLQLFSKMGALSFSLYLVHYPIFTGLSDLKGIWNLTGYPIASFCIYLILAFSFSIAIAWCLHRFVELPGIKFGKMMASVKKIKH